MIGPSPSTTPGSRESFVGRFVPILALTAICWLVFVVNNLLWNGHLVSYGILPRHLSSLPGIIWAPFLHTSFQHLTANTLPLLILGGIICGRRGNKFVGVTVAGIIIGGGLTWLLGRRAFHVGASGLIFCYFGYLISSAWFDRKILSFCVSLLCLVAYGGILRGILPSSAGVSWEGHLFGLISGVVVAWLGSRGAKAQVGIPPFSERESSLTRSTPASSM